MGLPGTEVVNSILSNIQASTHSLEFTDRLSGSELSQRHSLGVRPSPSCRRDGPALMSGLDGVSHALIHVKQS